MLLGYSFGLLKRSITKYVIKDWRISLVAVVLCPNKSYIGASTCTGSGVDGIWLCYLIQMEIIIWLSAKAVLVRLITSQFWCTCCGWLLNNMRLCKPWLVHQSGCKVNNSPTL